MKDKYCLTARARRLSVRPTLVDGVLNVYFLSHPMGTIDLRAPELGLVPTDPSPV